MSEENSGFAGSMQARAQQVIKEDYQEARAQVNDAAKSGSYMYPIKGVLYFFTHRALWKPFLTRIGPTLAVTVGVTSFMFAFTYLPQLAVLVFVNGPLAIATTVLLVLNESQAISMAIARNYIMQDALLDTFDGTLVSRGATGVVKEGRELQPGSDPIGKLGKVLKSPFDKFSPKAIVRYFIHMPLNFIPVVGTVIFIILQGRSRGQIAHGRYFQLKSWPKERQATWIKEHAGSYTAFGCVATLLEMIPVASLVFSYTTTVGAALWAADIEANGTQTTGSSSTSSIKED